ncbi:ABC-2 transporter permease [Coriobacteriales bacterium OH1046]|nr:ABC-2 transporter permease [Coriobacteriales bacterium OH1046]
MKAILFADLVTLKKSPKQYLLSIGIMCAIFTATALFDDEMDAEQIVGFFQGSITGMSTAMSSFFAFFQLFGMDEQAGWQSVRLSLPIARRDIVVSRYMILAAMLVVMLAGSLLLATALTTVITQVAFGSVTTMPASDILALAIVYFAAFLTYLTIELPLFFRMGLSKARGYFTLPFMACMLFMLKPVQEFAGKVGTQLMGVVGAIGSPWPLILGAAAAALVLYALSGLISLRLYSTREF